MIWKRLYKGSSNKDAGTLYQLRNLVNRRNVVKDPSKRVAACEEFFLLVAEAHILAAAMEVFEMSSLQDRPSMQLFTEESRELDPQQRRNIFLSGIQKIVHRFIDLTSPGSPTSRSGLDGDHVCAYAREILSLGALLMEFNDAIREGDGLRILRCWRFFLPLFKAADRTNYSIEAFTLLSQYEFLFTPRMQRQLLWNRTVNVHGKAGRNVSCDLHMEHINRECKGAIGILGSNISDETVGRVGRSIGELMKVTTQYDREHGVPPVSEKHSKRSTG